MAPGQKAYSLVEKVDCVLKSRTHNANSERCSSESSRGRNVLESTEMASQDKQGLWGETEPTLEVK